MIQLYTDGALAYDSRLEQYAIEGLQITTGLNIGGTATITLPRDHPASNRFISRRTIVTVYRDGALRFRGRVLYPAEDFRGRRTITCEGELCFFADGIHRPYKYEATPAAIFSQVVQNYNEQMTNYDFKQFVVGQVTVTDPNETILLESDSAETYQAVLNKLLDQCGGYFTFTDAANGARAINWLATLDRESGQQIEFGENLLDFTSTEANNPDFATTIIPYGAIVDEETGKRLTIESVNEGKDYVTNEEAKAIYGNIVATVTWDDVTKPGILRTKARNLLDARSVLFVSLELSALDLSHLDKSLDSFKVGDLVRVVSKPHGVNSAFRLTQMTEDPLHPEKSKILLGKDLPPLTRVTETVMADVNKNINLGWQKFEATYVGKGEAGNTYATKAELAASEQTVAKTYVTQTEFSNAGKRFEETYVGKDDANGTYATQSALNTEVNTRAGIINKVNGVVNISGGAPVKITGGRVDIDGTELHFGKEARFPNESGTRIANKDGTSYFVLRVDASNNCFVGNDYTNLYLRGKDAVYLHKTGAAVTSDQRQKNSIEPLPEAYTAMLDKLTPVRFRYNGRGDKYHVGFVAQEVDQALQEAGLSRDDFGGFMDVAGDGSNLGIVYDEFIGLLLDKVRRLEKRITELEENR